MNNSVINLYLEDDSWTEITFPADCTGYAVQGLAPGKAFQIKKESTDTAGWTVFPKVHDKTGKELRAGISMTNSDGYTGSIYVRTRNWPLHVEAIFY